MHRGLLPVLNWTILLALAYGWLILDIEGAGNLVKAFCWFGGVLGLLLMLVTPTQPSNAEHPLWCRRFAVWAWLLLVIALVWFGQAGYASLLALTSFGHHVYRNNFNADGSLKSKA